MGVIPAVDLFLKNLAETCTLTFGGEAASWMGDLNPTLAPNEQRAWQILAPNPLYAVDAYISFTNQGTQSGLQMWCP